MPDTIQGAADFFDRKTNLLSELRYAEAGNMSAYVKERAFFMASVTNADILQANRDVIKQVLAGQMTSKQAEWALGDIYKNQQLPVQPLPGLEGSIKDLRTSKRMAATIERGVEDARGWERMRQYSSDPAYPGLRLIRLGTAMEPRDWDSRWQNVCGRFKDACQDQLLALASSGIWVAISAFGRPSPPYDWGSHMTVEPVSLEECVSLGLLPDPETPEGKDALISSVQKQQESMNASVSKSVKRWDKTVKDMVTQNLKGLAEYDLKTHTIRMTDVNGTRPYNYKQIADIITKPLPKGIDHLQADALRAFIHNSNVYAPTHDSNGSILYKGTKRVGLNMKEDLARLIHRIEPTVSNGDGQVIMRGLEVDANQFLANVKQNGYGAREGFLCESWTTSPVTATHYAGTNGAILRCRKYQSRKRIDACYKTIGLDTKNPHLPESIEGESLIVGNVRFRYLGKVTKNGITYIDVEEEGMQ